MRTLKFAFRTLFRQPFVTSVAIISLAFGIGANSAIFSLFDQMLLRPLPVSKPKELVDLTVPGPKPGSQSCNQAGDCDAVFSYAMFRDLEKDNNGVFSGVVAHRAFGTNLAYKGQVSSSEGMFVSGSYFPTLGLQPALGRLIDPGDDKTIGEQHVVVLSHDYWQTRFGGSPAVLNDTMIVNGASMTIVGVSPRGFEGTTFGARPQVFVPITLRGVLDGPFTGFEERRTYWIYAFARLKPGMTIETASTRLNSRYRAMIQRVMGGLDRDLPLENLRTMSDQVKQNVFLDRMISTLSTAFALLATVLAAIGLYGVLAYTVAQRTREFGLRMALGAAPSRVRMMVMKQVALMTLVGVSLGAGITYYFGRMVESLLFEMQGRDPVVLVSSVLLLAAIAMLAGLLPALRASRIYPMRALRYE